MVPRDRSSRLIETRRYPIVVVGSVYIVLDVLLAAPDDLDGTVDLLGNFDREKGTIWLKPTAEASTQILIVDHNGFLRHSSERRDRRLRDGGLLRADPDFADVLPIVHRAIHRLHGCVSQKRQLIDRVQTPSRAGERLLEHDHRRCRLRSART